MVALAVIANFFTPLAHATVLKPIKEDAKRAHFKPSDFSQLTVDGSTDVILRQGTENGLVIDASSQKRERIEVIQEGSLLRIKMVGGWRFWDSGNANVTINVNFKSLEEIRMSGAGNLTGKGRIKVPKLQVHSSGAGDVDFEDIHAEELRVSVAGAGDAKVWATEELSVSIAGAGSVNYWGRPKVMKQSIAGVGSISDKGEK